MCIFPWQKWYLNGLWNDENIQSTFSSSHFDWVGRGFLFRSRSNGKFVCFRKWDYIELQWSTKTERQSIKWMCIMCHWQMDWYDHRFWFHCYPGRNVHTHTGTPIALRRGKIHSRNSTFENPQSVNSQLPLTKPCPYLLVGKHPTY